MPVQGRSEWEVFYAYPTISAPAFFEALARVSEEQADAPASAAQAYDTLLELSRVAQVRFFSWHSTLMSACSLPDLPWCLLAYNLEGSRDSHLSAAVTADLGFSLHLSFLCILF